jgi:hypothetical protein
MTGLVAYGIAKVHIQPPDTAAVAVQVRHGPPSFNSAEDCSLPLMLPSVLNSMSIVASVVTSHRRCRAV